MVVRDIIHLDEFAPDILTEMWSEAEIPEGSTTTVYTFGWSEQNCRFAGFAYRSTSNFASEVLQDGFGLKPPLNNMAEYPEIIDLDGFVEFMKLQKAEDRARPRMHRAGIGGDIIMTLLRRNENEYTSIEQRHIHRFDDYDQDWQIVISKLPENSNPLADILLQIRDP